MNRRGIALLASLWLITVLSLVAGTAIASARIGVMTSQNRLWLRRSEWAREACLQILLARWRREPSGQGSVATDLGQGVRCTAEMTLAGEKLNLNLADSSTLRRLIGSDSLTDAFLDWKDSDDTPRPSGAEVTWYRDQRRQLPRNAQLVSIEELSLIRGFDSATMVRLRRLVTTRGSGAVDLNAAGPEVLAALPGMSPGALSEIRHRRAMGRPLRSIGDLAEALAPQERVALMAAYQGLEQQMATASEELVVDVTGSVDGTRIRSVVEVILQPAGGRLAVMSRRPM